MTYEQFKHRYQIQLNQQQEAAVRQVEGPALLLAVPGSGKTTVIVTRLGYMLLCCGIDPRSILTVTYTVSATRDMKQRFAAKFGGEYADALQFRTINGICQSIIHTYARVKGRTPFVLISSDSVLSAIVRERMLEQGCEYPTDQQIKEIRTLITYCKNSMLTEQEIGALAVEGADFPALYRSYQSFMSRHGQMDYDDQMVIALMILRKHPDLLAQFQRRYRYISVDEAQDTSKIQHAILKLLAAGHGNIFMVGDEDQSIYGFRAAYPQALLAFEQTYPGAKVLLMETNYRSAGAIVERADAFIQHNRNRHPKHMRTENEPGKDIRYTVLSDYSRQYEYLAKVAQDCTVQTAILFRNNDSALPLLDLLERKGIPCTCRQRESFFFTSPIVRDITEMLQFAYDDCSADRFLNFYYKLDLKLKRSMLTAVLHKKPAHVPVLEALLESGAFEGWQVGKLKALQTHFSKLPGLTSYAAVQRIVKYMGYGDYLNEKKMDRSRLYILLALANQTPDTGAFLQRLGALRRLVEAREQTTDAPFLLSTIHSSKGLEYERVILIDVIDGLFPGVLPDQEDQTREEQEALEEERRLFYVGITRAKQSVEIFGYTRRFGEENEEPSDFVRQLLDLPPKVQEAPPKTMGVQWSQTERQGGSVSVLEKDYIPGTAVIHHKFGAGVLESKSGSIAVIRFAMGTKKVDLTACLQKNIIALDQGET